MAARRILGWLFVSCLIVLSLLVIMQQPWHGRGTTNVVKTLVIPGVNIAVVQDHEGFGSYATFLVIKTADKWEWYPISYDDFRWYTVNVTDRGGRIMVSKYGLTFAEYDPKTRTVTRLGVVELPTHETSVIKNSGLYRNE